MGVFNVKLDDGRVLRIEADSAKDAHGAADDFLTKEHGAPAKPAEATSVAKDVVKQGLSGLAEGAAGMPHWIPSLAKAGADKLSELGLDPNPEKTKQQNDLRALIAREVPNAGFEGVLPKLPDAETDAGRYTRAGARLVPGAVGAIPGSAVRAALSGVGSGVASEGARDLGAGPVGQFAAGVAGGVPALLRRAPGAAAAAAEQSAPAAAAEAAVPAAPGIMARMANAARNTGGKVADALDTPLANALELAPVIGGPISKARNLARLAQLLPGAGRAAEAEAAPAAAAAPRGPWSPPIERGGPTGPTSSPGTPAGIAQPPQGLDAQLMQGVQQLNSLPPDALVQSLLGKLFAQSKAPPSNVVQFAPRHTQTPLAVDSPPSPLTQAFDNGLPPPSAAPVAPRPMMPQSAPQMPQPPAPQAPPIVPPQATPQVPPQVLAARALAQRSAPAGANEMPGIPKPAAPPEPLPAPVAEAKASIAMQNDATDRLAAWANMRGVSKAVEGENGTVTLRGHTAGALSNPFEAAKHIMENQIADGIVVRDPQRYVEQVAARLGTKNDIASKLSKITGISENDLRAHMYALPRDEAALWKDELIQAFPTKASQIDAAMPKQVINSSRYGRRPK